MGFTKEEAHGLMRLQVAMWVNGKLACPVCRAPFASVDDYLARKPRAGKRPGHAKPFDHVDDACWAQYEVAAPSNPERAALEAFRVRFAPGVRVAYQNHLGVKTDLEGCSGTVTRRSTWAGASWSLGWVRWDNPPAYLAGKEDCRAAHDLRIIKEGG